MTNLVCLAILLCLVGVLAVLLSNSNLSGEDFRISQGNVSGGRSFSAGGRPGGGGGRPGGGDWGGRRGWGGRYGRYGRYGGWRGRYPIRNGTFGWPYWYYDDSWLYSRPACQNGCCNQQDCDQDNTCRWISGDKKFSGSPDQCLQHSSCVESGKKPEECAKQLGVGIIN